MGKTKRKVKRERPEAIDTRPKKKYAKRGRLCVGEENSVAGCVVIFKRYPYKKKKSIKLGFDIDSEHVIQEPKDNRLNTLASVYLKDKDDKLHQIQFMYYRLTGRLKDGSVVHGTYINQPEKKKKKKKSK